MRYWVYLAGEVPGAYEPSELADLPRFESGALVCPCEGELSERRWRPAAEFPDVAEAIRRRPPAPPSQAPLPSETLGPEDILDKTSLLLFRHVSVLMKDLETRRSERAETLSLRGGLDEAKQALEAARTQLGLLEDGAAKVPELQARGRELEEALARARRDAAEKGQDNDDLRRRTETAERESAAAKAELSQTNRLLAEKELALAKALAALGRFEKELAGMVAPLAQAPAEAPPLPQPPPPPPEPEQPPPLNVSVAPPWRQALDKALTSIRLRLSTRR